MQKKNLELERAILWQGQIHQQSGAYKQLVAAINQFAEHYEQVMAEPFTPQAYQQICKHDFSEIEKNFAKKADEAMAQIPEFGGLRDKQRDHLKSELLKLRHAFDELISNYFKITSNPTMPIEGVFFEEISIKGGRAVWTEADNKRIQEKYFTVYADETTNELQNLVGNFTTAWDALWRHITKGETPRAPMSEPLFNYFVPEAGYLLDGFLVVDQTGTVRPDWKQIFEMPTQYKP